MIAFVKMEQSHSTLSYDLLYKMQAGESQFLRKLIGKRVRHMV